MLATPHPCALHSLLPVTLKLTLTPMLYVFLLTVGDGTHRGASHSISVARLACLDHSASLLPP